MSQDQLRYKYAAFKASHNSYDRNEPIGQQLDFHALDPSNCGCSGLELDIYQKSDAWEWSVSHLGGYSSKPENQLRAWLQKIKAWTVANPGHRPITVHIDIKNTPLDNTVFPDKIDQYILSVFTQAEVFSPGSLFGEHDNLVAGAQAQGWPTLGELAGKLIFCFTGDETRKATYARSNARERLCFADLYLETDPVQYPDFTAGTRIFMNYHLWNALSGNWIPQLQKMAKQPAFITRGYVLNDKTIWLKAQQGMLNVMATDKVSGHSWAQNGDYPFRALIVE